ncbi:TetR/AcrR family transcriptional regulator [Nonomuraea sp. NN258]|uniref:TetR/AcrR family transcriptional regulator n=1 Tax=Nonomuraea antri TaxID=2730852 RepID=UPI001569D5B4|nr:TetR/AcrR family transcriptional regulator [Nonomuraea antri]NRQ30549.1 TetR/AcrR family transcriptional regulator [Nonomuraea antri]
MARPRKFDEGSAVEAAMRAFWGAGYEATSTQDLCEATGLGRSSIYNTFKNKHDLFGKSLRHYMDVHNAELFALLDADLPVMEKIRQVLWRAVEPDAADPIGCLVVNTAVELGPRDPEIAEMLRSDGERRLDALRAAIALGQSRGEIDRGKDPWALAHFVVATVGGLRVAARAGADSTALEAIATTALGAF